MQQDDFPTAAARHLLGVRDGFLRPFGAVEGNHNLLEWG
jgi:hypothetical protein